MTRAAAVKQADIKRAVEAAKTAGVASVMIEYPGGGKVRIDVKPASPQSTDGKAGKRKGVVL